MKDQWLVLKFGGTSVMGRRQWDTIASLARRRLDGGNRVLLVCSAVAGVTNALQRMAAEAGKCDEAAVSAIIDRHRRLADELGVECTDLFTGTQRRIERLLQAIHDVSRPLDRFANIARLLSIGEWLSTRVGILFLQRLVDVEWVDARDALQAIPEDNNTSGRGWLSARCLTGADPELQASWSSLAPVLLTQGYVVAHPDGGTALLGRGGSDTSAALLAGRLAAAHVEIWTDVPGLFSADPRVVNTARLLREVNYEESLEMAASGAKVVHQRCIRVAAANRIPIQIHDLDGGGCAGTVIRDAESDERVNGIRGVICQPDMVVLLLQNLDTREHVGFLARVFTEISQLGISIDLVATSETTTTVAINRTANQLDETLMQSMTERLSGLCSVTVYPDCSGINLVGRGVRTALAAIDRDGAFFARHPLLMLSQSANDLCISLLVYSRDAHELQVLLHRDLIEKSPCGAGAGIFGPVWQPPGERS